MHFLKLVIFCMILGLASAQYNPTPTPYYTPAPTTAPPYSTQGPESVLTISATTSVFSISEFTWSINKTANVSSITVPVGYTSAVLYSIIVTPTPLVGIPLYVNGTIVLTNTVTTSSVMPLNVTGVTVVLTSGETPNVTCDLPFPFLLFPSTSINCVWSTSVVPTGVLVNYTVTAIIESGSQSSIFPIDLTSPTPLLTIDNCTTVTDQIQGGAVRTLGTACAPGSTVFVDIFNVGPYYSCVYFPLVNTATQVGATTGITTNSTNTVQVTITGCNPYTPYTPSS